MDKEELTEIIEKGEDSFVEFKEEKVHPDDLAEELLRLYQATRSIYYDELPVPATSIDELDILYFRRFFENFYQTKIEDMNVDLNKLLENMKVLTRMDGELVFTVGGYLLFSLNPQKEFPFCKISIAKFDGDEIGEEFEKKDLEGNLEEQIDGANRALNQYLRTKVKIEGFENELKFEIPKGVLREAIVNAIAHRDYHIPSQIRIFIFDNRLEIMSPGRLPNTITLENIRLGIHLERNPLIVSYLAKMGYMTQIGTGIPRMIRLLKEHTGREPDFEERGQEFLVRIWRPWIDD